MDELNSNSLFHDPWVGFNFEDLPGLEPEDEQELQPDSHSLHLEAATVGNIQEHIATSEWCKTFFKETIEEGMPATTIESELLNLEYRLGANNNDRETGERSAFPIEEGRGFDHPKNQEGGGARNGDRLLDDNLMKSKHSWVSIRFSARFTPDIHHTFRLSKKIIDASLQSLSINEAVNEGVGEENELIIEIQNSRGLITAYCLSKEKFKELHKRIQDSGCRKLSISTSEKMLQFLTRKISSNPEITVRNTILELPFHATTLNGDISLNDNIFPHGRYCDIRISNIRYLMLGHTTRIIGTTLDSKILTPADIHPERIANDDYVLEFQLDSRKSGKTKIRRIYLNERLFEILYREMGLHRQFKLSFGAMVANLSGHSLTGPPLPEPVQTSTSSSGDLPETSAMSLPQVGQKHPLSVAPLLHSKRQRIDNAPAIGGTSITLADKLRELTIHQSTLNGKGLSDDLRRLGRKSLDNGFMIIRVSQVKHPDNDYAFTANANYLSTLSGLRPEDIQVQPDTMEDYAIEFVEKERRVGFRDLKIGRFYLPPDSFRQFYDKMYDATHKKNLLLEELLIKLSSSQ